MPAPLNIASLLAALTLEEKAALCLGADFWHTAPIPRLGIPAVALSDGPHGLRKQPDEGDHVAISGSLPATCYPTASALGSSPPSIPTWCVGSGKPWERRHSLKAWP